MKILLLEKFNIWNPGDTVDVADPDGARMVATGKAKEMHPDTPARIQYDPDIYQGGCHPNLEALAAKKKE